MASSYYDLQSWQIPQRQASWTQTPVSRSGIQLLQATSTEKFR